MLTQPVRTSSAKRSPCARSRVKIAESRPYGDAFVSPIACSSESIATTGRDRPERLLLRDERVGGHAVEHGRLPVEIRREAAGARTAVHELSRRARARRRTCSSIFSATPALFSGPIVVPSANGSPSTTRSATSFASRATNSSRTSRCTSNRSPAVQLCPAQRKQAVTAASAASSRSASSSTTTGPLPPSSSTAALPAAASATLRPVSVEPMKPTPCVPGCARSRRRRPSPAR